MKKLLIITGAGASLEFGMPSIREINELFEEWAKEVIVLKDDKSKSLYWWVKNKLESYCSKNSNNRMGVLTSFENILFTIQNLSALCTDIDWQKFNNQLMPFITINELPEVVVNSEQRIVNGNDFSFLHSYLVDKLLNHFRHLCMSVSKNKAVEINETTNLFSALRDHFEIGFINLNYDNVILAALPDLNTGFDKNTGEFKRNILYGSKWSFCYHMHGSVYFDMVGGKDTEMHKIFWNPDLSSTFRQNSAGRNRFITIQGISHLTSSIIAGLDKANQLLREPFISYYMQMDKLIYESDACLFIGYGFADQHLNSMFPFIRFDNKSRKVVIIDWNSNMGDGLYYRHDDWSYGLGMTIPFNGNEMGEGGEPQAAGYFKRNKIFEKSRNNDYPLAIWYDGFLEACKFPQKILEALF